MAIKRGGGPQGPRLPPRAARLDEVRQRDAAQRKEGSPAQRTEEVRSPALDADAFEDELSGPGVTFSGPGDRAEDVLPALGERPSAVRSAERLLETTRDRLAAEYTTLHHESTETVAALRQSGFSAESTAELGPRLRDQRQRMTKVRARLATIHRRLKALAVPAGRALDLQAQVRLAEQIQAVQRLERGAERTLAALHLVTTFRPRAADGAGALAVRVSVGDVGDKLALGTDLALGAPGAATAQLLARHLAAGRPTTTEEQRAPAGGSSDVRGLSSLHAALAES